MSYWKLFLNLIMPALLAFLSGMWAYYLSEMWRNAGEILLKEPNRIILISEVIVTSLISVGSLVFTLWKIRTELRKV